jgi:23S rRNA pseudouridine1911/1915/1917 synthase
MDRFDNKADRAQQGTHAQGTGLNGNLRVLYEDNHLLVVYKPAGMPTQAGQPGEPCLLETAREWVRQRHNKPGNVYLGLVHRLDRPVAGVMVLARTSKAASRLSQQLRARTMTKLYRALVSGRPQPAEGTWVDYVQLRPDGRPVLHESPGPERKQASLQYRVLRPGSPSLVEVTLDSGRKHQIRMQFAHRGHPIVGDAQYGSTVRFAREAIALVAWQLSFTHPTQPERRMQLTVPDELLVESMRDGDQ